ncbi:MAG: thiamine pyrophosphate-dependent enzyme [Treponemataceae bacterium]
MDRVYEKPASLQKKGNGFCPGCMHGTVTKLVAEAIDKFDIRGKTVCVLPIGCGTLSMEYFNFDMIVAAHGRAPAVATGYKRSLPENIVFTYQGDGDLAAIGLSEIMHAANRGENITTIFINNQIYGMTGGQMAPTTLVGQNATTCPNGRDAALTGYPMKMAEILATLEAPAYIARFALNTPANIIKARGGIEKAFKNQIERKGFSFVELLTNCPTNWGVTPEESLVWMKEKSIPFYPLGVVRDRDAEVKDGK